MKEGGNLLQPKQYKTYKNKLNHSLQIAKRLYYDKRLSESKSNIRATWRLLNEVLNSKKLRPKPNSVFKVDDQDISDPMEIANRFCHYFSNIGPNLAKRIQSTTSYKNFLPGHFPQSMFLNLATQEEYKAIYMQRFLYINTHCKSLHYSWYRSG